jgi:U3 small nucleolar RNA-associated protein 24
MELARRPPLCVFVFLLSPKTSTALFFKHNTSLGPPYQILIDTNFINFSITNKLDIFKSLMDCLLAKCVPILTDCVMAEAGVLA